MRGQEQSSTLSIIHAGLDEAGSLSAATPVFAMALVVVPQPRTVVNLIRRAALRSGKRRKRLRKPTAELKWRNASQSVRSAVLTGLAQTDASVFTLTIRKQGRRIEDSPENYAILVCELLGLCWDLHPDIALSLDRHFTSPAHVATVNTFVHRQWPATGILSITHVNSQRSPLVQLADFVAGSVYDWHKERAETIRLIEENIQAGLVEDWQYVKARWTREGK